MQSHSSCLSPREEDSQALGCRAPEPLYQSPQFVLAANHPLPSRLSRQGVRDMITMFGCRHEEISLLISDYSSTPTWEGRHQSRTLYHHVSGFFPRGVVGVSWGSRLRSGGSWSGDRELEGMCKDTRHKIYIGSGRQGGEPYVLFGDQVWRPALGVGLF
jgi:hypothetical protein